MSLSEKCDLGSGQLQLVLVFCVLSLAWCRVSEYETAEHNIAPGVTLRAGVGGSGVKNKRAQQPNTCMHVLQYSIDSAKR